MEGFCEPSGFIKGHKQMSDYQLLKKELVTYECTCKMGYTIPTNILGNILLGNVGYTCHGSK
jgi:hypothetical protein